MIDKNYLLCQIAALLINLLSIVLKMQSHPSYHFIKDEHSIKPEVERQPHDTIDLTLTHGERRVVRKSKYSKRRTDDVDFVDLSFVCDYDAYLRPCIDETTFLNTKGPFANLWWGFTKIKHNIQPDLNEATETDAKGEGDENVVSIIAYGISA